MFTIDYEVEVSCKTMCEIPHFYFSDYMYVIKTWKVMPKCRQWLVMGSRVTDDFYFISAYLLFSKNIFLHNDAYIILKGKQTKKKTFLKNIKITIHAVKLMGFSQLKIFHIPSWVLYPVM